MSSDRRPVHVIAAARTRAGWSDAAAAILGAGVGALVYFTSRQLSLEGPDYDGTWLVIPLAVSGWALLFWTLGGGLSGLAVLAFGRGVRDALARRRQSERPERLSPQELWR